MTGSPPVVWVLVAELSRTGVPVVLERSLRWLDPAARAGVHVIAGRGGPVGDGLRAAGVDVVELGPPVGRSLPGGVAAALDTVGAAGAGRWVRRGAGRLSLRSFPAPDVVLVHGAGGIPLMMLVPERVPVVVHLHELPTGLARSGDPALVRAVLQRATSVLAVAGPTAALAVDAGAAPDRVVLVPGVVEGVAPVDRVAARRRARAVLGLGDGTPVVGGAGRPGWRKGTGRLPALAHELQRRLDGTAVVWVGGRPAGAEADWVGAPDGIRWIDERPDPWSVLGAADVVVVPSREDPLPLVALEAGQHGIPVVGTATGGLPDLLADGRGAVVGTHDLAGLVAGLESFLRDPDRAASAGAGLRDHVAEHHDVDVVGPRWWGHVTGAAGR